MTMMDAAVIVANPKQLVGRRKLRRHMRNRGDDTNTSPKKIFPNRRNLSMHTLRSPIELTASEHGRPTLGESESEPPKEPTKQPANTTAVKDYHLRPFDTSINDAAYIADHSILQAPAGGHTQDVPVVEPSFLTDTPKTLDMILQVSEADILPPQPLRGALIDSFFRCLADSFPMIERDELDSPRASTLLQQAVCFAGSLIRPSSPQWSLGDTKALYDKVMLLISIHYERNALTVLKAMCLLTLWSPKSPNRVSLVGPWHVTGSALRLAIQMGMHCKSTLLGKADTSCRLKIIWMLHASDCVLSMVYGRPPLLRPEDLDIPVLTKDNYSVLTQGALAFMADMTLSRIMGEIAELTSRSRLSSEQQQQFHESLKSWVCGLPAEISLYAEGIRMPYHFSTFEVHIAYLGTIILLQVLTPGSGKQLVCSIASVIAAVTMADLYEDILCRDQAPFLAAIHGFFCTVAAIPLLQYKPASPEWETRRVASLDVICSVVSNLENKFGLAFTASRKIAQLKSDRANVIEPQNSTANGSPGPGNYRLGTSEMAELEALFPSLNHWCPGLETIAAGVDADIVQDSMTPTLDSWNMDTVLGEPRSILDELGGPSAFMDTLFNGNDLFDDMALEDATVHSYESRC
ncbi:hypothetical protein PV08_10017 [Exophiala spinifera]|uniref:Xylanolytic transcriptional activator regulatory domain-containing protein n=1 Tax=Exophiala spinifera TaxID=91928 RepID=A0A0D2AVG0_9EURO|nr:uncharacterized protein PV08_10017 [Exophiala spinifera]KIW10718.1 hypothetical protein PV08_10017 [Exophiala spinifera]